MRKNSFEQKARDGGEVEVKQAVPEKESSAKRIQPKPDSSDKKLAKNNKEGK